MERIIPRLSKLALGVRHQGWQIQCEPVLTPSIPSKEDDRIADFSKTTTSNRPVPKRIQPQEALPFSRGLSSLLRGYISRDGGKGGSSSAMWLWKTQASHVKEGKVIALRANSEHGGLGCGRAGDGEKVILLLAGSGLDESGPLVGPLAWTITRQSGLRMLIVQIRKMRKSSKAGRFPTPLQDALAGCIYLVDRLGFLPHNITLLGEGIGAGLCVSLTLYLSALIQVDEVAARISRPGKLLLYSPWRDMTVSADILRDNSRYDVVNLDAQLKARSRYGAGFDNTISDDMVDSLIADLCSRYQNEEDGKLNLFLLGSELANIVEALGSRHPLVSPGMSISRNEYTKMTMQLLGVESGCSPLEILICAGSAEVHVTEVTFPLSQQVQPTAESTRSVKHFFTTKEGHLFFHFLYYCRYPKLFPALHFPAYKKKHYAQEHLYTYMEIVIEYQVKTLPKSGVAISSS